MNQDSMLKPALIGGVLLGVLSAIPKINWLNCFCCAWVIGGGVLAANLYVKSATEMVTLGRGVTLGLLTGAIGAVVYVMLTIPILFIMMRSTDFFEQFQKTIEQMPNLPSGTADDLRRLLDPRTGLWIFVLVLGSFFALIVFSVMGMLGGALGVAIFEKRSPATVSVGMTYEPPSDFPPPPPPPTANPPSE